MDLEEILATGWAEPDDFTAEEFAVAERFWLTRRNNDAKLLAAKTHASQLITSWTGRTPRDVGSFGTKVNLDTSDLDLGIGYPIADRAHLTQALAGHATFKGERFTRFNTTRLVYAFDCDGIQIDLSALTEEDFAVACRMLDQIEAGMTREERIVHTWVKHLLRTAGRLDDYATWKLVVYARYCPEFNWVPITETPESLHTDSPIALPDPITDLTQAAESPGETTPDQTTPTTAR